MEPRLQRRVQRYGWDLAAASYEPLWRAQLASAQATLLARAALAPGEQVLDVACGTGLITFAAAEAIGRRGRVVGIDLSERMVEAARRRAAERDIVDRQLRAHGCREARFARGGVRRRVVRARPHVHARSRAGDPRDASCPAARRPHGRSRMGRPRPDAGGRRCFRSSMPKSRAKSARSFSTWERATRSRGCAPTSGSRRSSSVGSRRRSITPTPMKRATQRSLAVPSRSRGRASTTAFGRASAAAISKRSSLGDAIEVTGYPANSCR